MFSLLLRSIRTLSFKEKRWLHIALVTFLITFGGAELITYYTNTTVGPASGGTYTEGMVGQPIAVNPVLAGQNDVDRDLTHLVFAPFATLIETATSSLDYTTWDITLKDGLKWSDGRDLGAEDVKFTITTIQDPDTHSPLAQTWAGVSIDILSSRAFRLTLTDPYVFFRNTLDNLRIIPKHIFSVIPTANLRLSDYNFEPVGNGPYRFVRYEKRSDGFISRYVLERNPYYVGQKPHIDAVNIAFFTKEDDLIDAFNARKITGFGAGDARILSKITISKTVYQLSLPRYYAVFLNTNASAPLKELAVRKALRTAIQRDQIIQSVFEGNAISIQGPLVPGTEGYSEIPLATSTIEDAGALLDDAGWKLGDDGIRSKTIGKTKTPLEFNLFFPSTPTLEATAALLELQWKQIGVALRLNPMTPEETASALKTRSYHMLLFGNILAGTDLFSFWHSGERFFPGSNLALYQNTKVDALLEKARKEPDAETRIGEIQKAQDLILADAPAVFLFNPSYLFITAPKLLGIEITTVPTPSNRFDSIGYWYLRSGRVFK